MDEEKIKEYIFLAVQSGKKETSDLVAHILNRVENVVDGKVRALQGELHKKLDDYIASDNEWKKNDTEWKKNADPAIEVMGKLWNFTSVGGYILKAVMLIGGAGTAMWAIIKFFKKISS